MDLKISSFPLIFLLLVLQFVDGIGARQIIKNEGPMFDIDISEGTNVLKLHSMDGVHGEVHNHLQMQSNNAKQIEEEKRVNVLFFEMKDLKVGKTLRTSFVDRVTSPPTLSREEAEAIPFSSKQLQNLLQFFSFSEPSPQAKAMESTLKQCESEPENGVIKLCATSVESMFDFIHSILGSDTPIKALSTPFLNKPYNVVQNYTIFDAPKEITAPKTVTCHTMPYPYAVFFCHSQDSFRDKVILVPLESDDGEKFEAISTCHLMGGSSPLCHLLPAGHSVWVPSATN